MAIRLLSLVLWTIASYVPSWLSQMGKVRLREPGSLAEVHIAPQ